MSDAKTPGRHALLDRRRFLLGVAAALTACSKSILVTTKYPRAERCGDAGCTMVDVHCHVFNASDLNVSGFVSHILPVPPKLTSWLTDMLANELYKRTDSAREELDALAKLIADESKQIEPAREKVDPGKLDQIAAKLSSNAFLLQTSALAGDVLGTLMLIIQPRRKIAARMAAQYSAVDLFTPALVDYTYWSADKPESPLQDQLAVQSALAKASMLGRIGAGRVRIHPIAPFNPLREVREAIEPPAGQEPTPRLGKEEGGRVMYACDAPAQSEMPQSGSLGPLRYAIEQLGFVGAKVYPPTGFKPIANDSWEFHRETTKLGSMLDQALHDFYAYCEAEHVPLMTHANNSNGYNLGYGMLTGPDAWEEVLRLYPNLRLNLGHFGELSGDDPKRGFEACELWMGRIADMMQRYPNVYADSGCSFVPVEQEFQDRYLTLLAELYEKYDKASLRFMYGSDFWLNKFYANSDSFLDAFVALYKARFPEQARNFFGDNALRFLGMLDDRGNKPDDNRNRLRLRAWYKRAEEETKQKIDEPAWLAD